MVNFSSAQNMKNSFKFHGFFELSVCQTSESCRSGVDSLSIDNHIYWLSVSAIEVFLSLDTDFWQAIIWPEGTFSKYMELDGNMLSIT